MNIPFIAKKEPKQTFKLLFVNLYTVKTDSLFSAIKNKPIAVIFDQQANPAYIVDTGIEVKKK